jgi:hypothetical protein
MPLPPAAMPLVVTAGSPLARARRVPWLTLRRRPRIHFGMSLLQPVVERW